MAIWKDIRTAPQGESILVCGGMLDLELEHNLIPMTEAVKVEFNGRTFDCVDTSGYSVMVVDPTHWQELPKPLLPEFDL